MPRKRMVDPKFFKDWELYEAEQRAGLPLRLAYEGLWAVADREGRFAWKPEQIKTDVLPYDVVDFRLILEALLGAGFVRYYAVEGKSYGWIPNFKRYQPIHPREAKSLIPEPPPEPDLFTPKANLGSPKAGPGNGEAMQLPPASTSTSTSTSVKDTAPNGASPPGGWPAAWARVCSDLSGEFDPGRIGKRCAPVRRKYGPERSLEMWDVYCRQRRHFRFGKFDPEHDDPRAATPEDFAQTAKTWFDLTEPIVHAST